MKKVLVAGGFVIDFLLLSDNLPLIKQDKKQFLGLEYPSKTPADHLVFNEGGSGANVAINLQLLNVNTSLIAVLGDDFLGHQIFDKVSKIGLNVKYISFSNKAQTGVSIIFTREKLMDRSMITYKGANDLLEPKQINEEFVSQHDLFVWCSLTSISAIKAYSKIIKIMHKKSPLGEVMAAPSSSMIKRLPNEVRDLVIESDMYATNLEEARIILQDENLSWIECVKILREHGLKFISITNGENGSMIYHDGKIKRITSLPVQVKDTSGVGDAFTAGLIYGLVKGKELDEIGKIGTIMAWSVLQEYGTRKGIPTEEKLLKIFEEKKDLIMTITQD
ncbi:MAG: carbohydrate kinase family protein [Candidatus Helarchaeota archaeon]